MISIKEKMRIREKEFNDRMRLEKAKRDELMEAREKFEYEFRIAMINKKSAFKKKYKGKLFNRIVRPDVIDFVEVDSGQKLVEEAGYVPISEQVRRFTEAGVNLKNELAKQYDYSNPTEDFGFNMNAVDQYPTKIGMAEATKNVLQAIKDYKALKKAQSEEVILDETAGNKEDFGSEGNVKKDTKDEEATSEKTDSQSKSKPTTNASEVSKSNV